MRGTPAEETLKTNETYEHMVAIHGTGYAYKRQTMEYFQIPFSESQ